MHFGIEDINLNTLDRVMDEINGKFGYRSEIAMFSVAAIQELQRVADEINEAKKLKIIED